MFQNICCVHNIGCVNNILRSSSKFYDVILHTKNRDANINFYHFIFVKIINKMRSNWNYTHCTFDIKTLCDPPLLYTNCFLTSVYNYISGAPCIISLLSIVEVNILNKCFLQYIKQQKDKVTQKMIRLI